MKQFGRWYVLLLKAQMKKIENWLAIVIMLVGILLLSTLSLPQGFNLNMGVYCPDERLLDEVMTLLDEEETIFQFKRFDSEKELCEQVESGRMEAGFSIHPDYKERFEQKEQKGIVSYYSSSYSTTGNVAKETLYLILLKTESEIFLQSSIDEIYEDADAALPERLSDRQSFYMDGDALLSIQTEIYGKQDDVIKYGSRKLAWPFEGTIAIMIFLAVFLAMGDYMAKENVGYPIYLTRREKVGFAFTKGLAAATPVAIVGYVLTLFFGEIERSPIISLLLLIALVAYSIVWCFALSKVTRHSNHYMASLLAVLVLIVIVSKAYLDLSPFIPVLIPLRWLLPVSLYLI